MMKLSATEPPSTSGQTTPERGLAVVTIYGVVMPLLWEQIVVDSQDPVTLGRWWAHALGWPITIDEPDEFEIQPQPGSTPGIIFVKVPEGKTVKNRIHVDLRPEDQAAEVERFLSLGATRADIGQQEQTWVVLADPEGNEFCVLAGRRQAA